MANRQKYRWNFSNSMKNNNNNNLLASLNDPSLKTQFILTIPLPLPYNNERIYNTAMI